MSQTEQTHTERGPSHRSVEIAVAVITALFGAIVMYGSVKAGIGWGAEGPMAGFFPFYIGLIIVGASIANLVPLLRTRDVGAFATWRQLGQVMSVVIPTAIYVAVIPLIGIYVSSAILIGGFMKWIGDYKWPLVLAVAIGMPVVTFIVFERWFLVPLPKGPLEEMLGY